MLSIILSEIEGVKLLKKEAKIKDELIEVL